MRNEIERELDEMVSRAKEMLARCEAIRAENERLIRELTK